MKIEDKIKKLDIAEWIFLIIAFIFVILLVFTDNKIFGYPALILNIISIVIGKYRKSLSH